MYRKSVDIRTQRSYYAMKSRCTNPRDSAYKDYGGRGICYDPRWETLDAFLADMGTRPIGMSLDRIDNSGNYTKDNCRWATQEQQHNNKRSSRLFEYEGKSLSMPQWARELRIPLATLWSRFNKGWPLDKVFSRNTWQGSKYGSTG